MKKNLFIAGFLFILLTAFGQNQGNLEIYQKVTPNEIRLKFVPQSPAHWYEGAQSGYVVERREAGSGEEFERLTPDPVLPASEEEMQQLAQDNPPVRGMIRQLYGLEPPCRTKILFRQWKICAGSFREERFFTFTSRALAREPARPREWSFLILR